MNHYNNSFANCSENNTKHKYHTYSTKNIHWFRSEAVMIFLYIIVLKLCIRRLAFACLIIHYTFFQIIVLNNFIMAYVWTLNSLFMIYTTLLYVLANVSKLLLQATFIPHGVCLDSKHTTRDTFSCSLRLILVLKLARSIIVCSLTL